MIMISRAALVVVALCAAALSGCVETVQGANWSGPDVWTGDGRLTSKKALQEHVEGVAVLVCRQAEEGRLADCRIGLETPEGYGFADAAMRMSGQMKIVPAERRPLGEILALPVSFCPTPKDRPACQARAAQRAKEVAEKAS